MSEHLSEGVPFQLWGDRLVLTDEQLAEEPWLADFVGRFPDCFERLDLAQMWIYHPDGRPGKQAEVDDGAV